MLPPDAPARTSVGSIKTYLPYFFYTSGRDHYPLSKEFGTWLSFTRDGNCGSDTLRPSTSCSWERLPQAKIIHGTELLAAGWDRTSSFVREKIIL